MKKTFRYLSLLTATYVIATSVSISPRFFQGKSIFERTIGIIQLVIADEESDGCGLSFTTPFVRADRIVVLPGLPASVEVLNTSRIVITDRQFLLFRNLRI